MVDVRLNDGGARITKSRKGRPKVAHGFNRGLRVENGQSPGGAKEKMGLDRCVLSSLTGLVLCSRHNPAINRWAIFERPCGTWNRDTLKHGQSPEDYPHAVAPRLLHRLGDLRLPEHLPAGGPHRFRICRRRHRTRRASTRRTPPATFLERRCHRGSRGWPQTPVRTTPTSSAAARQVSRSKMIALVIGRATRFSSISRTFNLALHN